MHLCEVRQIPKRATSIFQNCVCSSSLFCFENNISEVFSTQIFAMKVDEPLKTIFYSTHYTSLLKKANLKTEHAHFSKLCLLKRVVLYEKQHFRVFESSNIRNKNKQVNKSNFLFCKTQPSINLSKTEELSRPLFKTVSTHYFYFS